MKPAPFRYTRPESLDEAVAVLQQYGEEGKVLAGGQSLVPVMNMRLARPEVIVDINRIPGLDEIVVGDGRLRIGAGARQRRLEDDSRITQNCPLLAQAAPWIGHPATRNRGTVVGSIVHADPAAELPLVLLTLDGELVVRSARGTRTIPASDLYLTTFTTTLEPDELAVEVRFPVLSSRMRCGFLEFAQRHGDFALVAVAVVLGVGEDDRVVEARIGVGGAGPVPYRAGAAEEALVAGGGGPAAITEAARLAAEASDPVDDAHAGREYRKELVRVITARVLRQALVGVEAAA